MAGTVRERAVELDARERDTARGRVLAAVWPIATLWAVLAVVLAALTTQVRDWFAMTNEMLYERRAISVAETLSPLPMIHGTLIRSWDQLYPLLIAPAFAAGHIPADLQTVHVLNAVIMSSACIPAYLLARRVTGVQWASLVVAALSVCAPWIWLASFLLTEVAAYPVFLWTMLAFQRSAAAPSRRNDIVALLAVALAFTARTQLGILLAVPPVAIFLLELGRADGDGIRARFTRAGRRAVAGHRLLALVYAIGLALFLLLAVAGSLASIFGVYGQALGGRLVPHGMAASLLSHLATLALGLGILPLVVAVAWLTANAVRPPARIDTHAFACIGCVTLIVQIVELTRFDLEFGGFGNYVHDRYLIYLAPVVLLGFFCALLDRRRPRWSLVAPAALVALGFVVDPPPRFLWQLYPQINSDAPILFLWKPVVQVVHSLDWARATLAVGTVLLTLAFAAGARLLPRGAFTAILTGLAVLAVPASTVYLFVKLFDADSWSGRPLTSDDTSSLTWVDSALGTGGRATIIPSPTSSDFYVSQQTWRDLEYFNRSVVRDAQYGANGYVFRYTDPTFPKITLAFDPRTGLANASPTPYALEAIQETRFRISGTIQEIGPGPGVFLIVADRPWRTDWLSSGLYDDGWTKPGVPVRVRVFATPGQRGARLRSLQFGYRAPDNVASRPVEMVSNVARWRGLARADTQHQSIPVCVPARGFAEVVLRAPGSSPIPGDLADAEESIGARQGGIFISQINLADEVGPRCVSGAATPRGRS